MNTSVIERTKPSTTGTGGDELAHVFCTWCKRADRRRAIKPKPFCGKEKEGEWKDLTNQTICQMCVLLARESPCPRCGNKSVI